MRIVFPDIDWRVNAVIWLASLGILLAATRPAWPSFTVCNQTFDIANIAIGDATSGQIVTRGWWVIAPNRCADIVVGDLKSRYFYLHAVDVRGNLMLPGDARFCTRPHQFEVEGTTDCWQRGHATGLFQEIDTKDAQSWTVFLREPDPAGGGNQ